MRLLSLFVFGVTLEALNDPKELSAIPFNPWDFLTYGLIALGIPLLIRIVRKPDPRKTLAGKWTSDVKNERGRNRTALRLNQDGNAQIDIKGKVAGFDERLRTSARWQISDDRTLHLLGAQSLTWKIVKLSNWSMTTAALAESSFPVHWIKHPKVNSKVLAWLRPRWSSRLSSPYLYRAPSPPALSLKIRNGCLPLPHVIDIDERV